MTKFAKGGINIIRMLLLKSLHVVFLLCVFNRTITCSLFLL